MAGGAGRGGKGGSMLLLRDGVGELQKMMGILGKGITSQTACIMRRVGRLVLEKEGVSGAPCLVRNRPLPSFRRQETPPRL